MEDTTVLAHGMFSFGCHPRLKIARATETDALLNKQAWISNKVFFRIDISTQQWEAGVGTEIPERLRVARNRPRWCAESTEF